MCQKIFQVSLAILPIIFVEWKRQTKADPTVAMVVTGTAEWATGVLVMSVATAVAIPVVVDYAVQVYTKRGKSLCVIHSIGNTIVVYVKGNKVEFHKAGRLRFGVNTVDFVCGGQLGLVVTCSVCSGFQVSDLFGWL